MQGSDGYRPRMTARRPRLAAPPTLLVLLLACAALLLAACGDDGPSKEDYEQGLAGVQRHLADATDASRASGDTVDPAERTEHLDDAHHAIAAAATAAGKLDPPEDVAKTHAKFESALRDYADLFDRLAKLEPNDPSETELYSEAGAIAKRLDSSSRALKKAGYEVDRDES